MEPKKVFICQSNYIPWKGYFDMINMADMFIYHDDLQYTKGDWRNRNKIKGQNGLLWLTIPCGTSEKRLINEVEINDSSWQNKHWNLIVNNYSRAPYFNDFKTPFLNFYTANKWENLSELNQYLINMICTEILGIDTPTINSTEFTLKKTKSERVIELLKHVGATSYLSGPAGMNYLDKSRFEEEQIELEYMDYSGYPVYEQQYDGFFHEVSILDLIFNTGPNARKYLKSFNNVNE